jgi:hypothetical protein
MTSRCVHDGLRSSKRETKPGSGTKDEGGNGYNHIRAAFGVLTRSQSVNKQSKGQKVAEIANSETSYYHSASEYSRVSKGRNGYKDSLIDSSII